MKTVTQYEGWCWPGRCPAWGYEHEHFIVADRTLRQVLRSQSDTAWHRVMSGTPKREPPERGNP